jgi:hypothetical protein
MLQATQSVLATHCHLLEVSFSQIAECLFQPLVAGRRTTVLVLATDRSTCTRPGLIPAARIREFALGAAGVIKLEDVHGVM